MIGGNDSGLSAAGRAKRMNPELDVVVLEKTGFTGYASCGFPYLISGQVPAQKLSGYSPESVREKRGFEVKTGILVTAIDTFSKLLLTQNVNTGTTDSIKYDKLIIAVGAKPIVPEELNVRAKNIFTLRNFSDAEKINNFIREDNPQNAIIIGGGYIGIEMAEAFLLRGLNVILIEKSARLFPDFIPEISDPLVNLIKSKGIRLICGDTIKKLNVQNNNVHQIQLNNADTASAADIILVSAGIAPDIALAQNAGIPIGSTGAIKVNQYMQTRRLDIFAAGDCAETNQLITNKPAWLPLAGIASRQGRIAGNNSAGGREIFPGALGTVMIKVFGFEMGKTGLSFQEAQNAGFAPVITVITHSGKPEYIKDNSPVTVGLITDSRSGRLLGAQIAGSGDAGLRLNILATAISSRLSVNDLAFLDFGYTPLITNVWDPIAVAGNVALKNIKEKK
ncbi:FAD-dependent oxidoreductase [candidate division KSB1 bacterium]|nr:FAD-dependent oxidoreductase [candidate division KSB1 bacterium]